MLFTFNSSYLTSCFIFTILNNFKTKKKQNSKPLISILKTSEAKVNKEFAINEKPEIIKDETDAMHIINDNNSDTITPSVCSTLKLSSVTMSTKSILDRYRTNNKISANDFIRGTYPVTSDLWDKLSLHSRDKSDSLKYDILYFHIYILIVFY